MAYSKTTELRNTKAKIKELESKVALLESDLELSDTLYKTYKRIQDETEADLNDSEKAVDALLEASVKDEIIVNRLEMQLEQCKLYRNVTLVSGFILIITEVIIKAFG